MVDVLSWDKSIDKDVKTSDDKKVGKIRAITSDFIQIEKGKLDKKYYFVPKTYVQEYDGKKVHLSLTKDEVKDKFERDSPPLSSELESSKRTESTSTQNQELIPPMAKEPGLEMRGQESGEILHIPWEEVIHKHVMTSDNIDMGDVDKVGNEFIVVREGVVKVHMYYVPKVYITNYDGSSLYLNDPSGLTSAKFERDSEPTQQEIDMMIKEADNKTSKV